MFLFQCSCFHTQCSITSYKTIPNASHHQQNQHLQQQHQHNQHEGSQRIDTNKQIESVLLSGHHLRLGSDVSCIFQRDSHHQRKSLVLWRTMERQSSMLIFHVMFWPSLLFISGFVGLFFSCVALQHEIYDLEQTRRRQKGAVLHTPLKPKCSPV